MGSKAYDWKTEFVAGAMFYEVDGFEWGYGNRAWGRVTRFHSGYTGMVSDGGRHQVALYDRATLDEAKSDVETVLGLLQQRLESDPVSRNFSDIRDNHLAESM